MFFGVRQQNKLAIDLEFNRQHNRDFKIHYGEALLRLQEVKFHTR